MKLSEYPTSSSVILSQAERRGHLAARACGLVAGICSRVLLLTLLAAVPLSASTGGLNGSFSALTAVEGAIVGVNADSEIVRSRDGGISFETLRTATASDTLHSIAASGSVVLAGGDSGLLLRADLSVDPSDWTEVASGDTPGSVRGLAHDGAGTWVAVVAEGSEGAVLRSTDDGLNWSLIETAPAAALHAVGYDGTRERWIAVGGDGFEGAAFYSADGTAWNAAELPLTTNQILSVAVDGNGLIVAVGEAAILESADGGASYSALEYPPSEDLNSVVALSPGVFLAVGADGIVVGIEPGTYEILTEPVAGSENLQSTLAVDGSALIPGVAPVAAPQIDPHGGVFVDPVSVTLSGPAGAALYYTLDGSVPSSESTLYGGAFVVDSGLSVRAIAVLDGTVSPVATADFDFSSPPVVLPALHISALDADTFELVLVDSEPGAAYQLRTSIELDEWTNLHSVRTGDGGPITWTVDSDGPRRFYRVALEESGGIPE